MGTLVKYGLLLAAGVIVWMFVMGFTGWYMHPTLVNLFFLVIPFQVFLVVRALRETARQGAGYAAQIGAGVAISSIAAILIFGASLAFTTVAFPTYFADIHAMQERLMREAGLSEDRIAMVLEKAKREYTPMSHAIQGFFGTVITGLVTAVIAGRWIRRTPAPVASSGQAEVSEPSRSPVSRSPREGLRHEGRGGPHARGPGRVGIGIAHVGRAH